MKTRVVRASLAIIIMLALVWTPAISFAGETKVPHATGVKPAANSATPDSWEDDDTQGTAHSLTTHVPAEGDGFYTQAHTIDTALNNAYDVDWYYLDVTDEEIAMDEVKFLIQAVSYDQDVDLVVEVYADGQPVGNPVTDSWGLDPGAYASNDDSFWSYNPSAELIPTSADRFWIRVRPYYAGSGFGGFTGHAGAYTLKIQRTLAERVAGANRIATAIEASKRGLSTSPVASRTERTILIANSQNYPDALAGASLAGAYGGQGSLLLTPQDSLPSAVAAEIVRTGARNVYVLGGDSVVSNTVLGQISAINPALNVKRVSGTDRIKTSNAIAREAFARMGQRRFAIVAYAYNYPDALAATPVSAFDGMPVFLTRTAYISTETLDAMSDIGVTDVIIVGGTSVVSNAVFDGCAAQLGGTNHVLRLAGANRYETSKEIALWSCDLKGPGVRGDGLIGTTSYSSGAENLYIENSGLASGENFPDALSGGVLLGVTGHPILLTPKSNSCPYIYDIYLQLPAGKTDFFNDAGSPPHIGDSLVFGSSAAIEKLPVLIYSLMLGY